MLKRFISLIIILSVTLTFMSCFAGDSVGDSKAAANNPENSESKTMISFLIVTPSATGIIDEISKTVSVTVPYGTDVRALVAEYATTGESTTVNEIEQISGVTVQDFTNPVIYTVTAEDDTTANYTVVVTVAGEDAKAITSFSILGVSATINEAAKTIGLTLPYGTDVTYLAASFTTTGTAVKIGDVIQASGVTANNYTNNVIYTVEAADGTKAYYTVAVSVALNSAKELTSFSINGVSGTINQGTKTIGLTLPYGTDVTALVATFTTTGKEVVKKTLLGLSHTNQISGVTANDFTNPVVYTVIAEDETEADYTVAVSVAAGTAKEFTSFSINGVSGTINQGTKTIGLTLPYGTNVTSLVAAFSINGSSVKVGGVTQVSGGTANNFSGSVVYTVVAADGSEQNYTVIVEVALSSAKAITAFSINGVSGTIDDTAHTIALTVSYGTDVTALAAVFTTTGASVKVNGTVQVSGTTQNNFTSSVVYTVTADNGTYRSYTVTVTVAPSDEKDITVLSINGVSGTIDDYGDEGIISLTLPIDTDVTSLIAAFTTTGASVEVDGTLQVSGVTLNNFTDYVTYTVKAEDGSTKEYYVVVELRDYINQWARTSNSSYGESTYYSVKAGNNGFVYAAGEFHQSDGYTFDLGNGVTIPGTADYYTDMIVVKYDNLGNAQWAKTVSGGVQDSKFNAVTDDNVGNVYAAGYVSAAGTMDFGNGVNLNASGFRSVIVMYNSSGMAQWVKTVPGAWFFAVAVDGDGNVYAAGKVSGTGTIDCGDGQQITALSTYWDILLVKYNSTGQTQWARTFKSKSATGTMNAYYHSLAIDVEGNVYAAGEGSGTFNFGFENDKIVYSTGAILVKYNTDGIPQWATSSINDEGYDESGGYFWYATGSARYYSLSIDNNGNIYTAGCLNKGVSFGNSVIVWGPSSYNQSVIVKYNSSGVAQWAKTVATASDTSEFYSISVDNSGNIYAAGSIQGISEFNFGNNVIAKGVNNVTSSNNYNWRQNSVLVKYDESGVAQWAKTAVSAPGATQFECVSTDNNGHAYVAGYLNTRGSYDFGNYVTVYKRSSNPREHVIVKYKENY